MPDGNLQKEWPPILWSCAGGDQFWNPTLLCYDYIFHFPTCPKTQSCNCCFKLMTISDLRGRSLPELYWPPITFNVKSISYINSHDPATLPLVKRSPQFIVLGPLLPHWPMIDRSSILTLISREEIIKNNWSPFHLNYKYLQLDHSVNTWFDYTPDPLDRIQLLAIKSRSA